MILKILKWLVIVISVLALVLAMIVSLRQNLKFDAPLVDVKATTDSAVIAKGEYIFYGPGHCLECHCSNEDYAKVENGGRVLPAGGFTFPIPIGVLRTPNITSDKETGIGNISDGMIARALRYGVGHDGHAMLDFMAFHNTSDEDLTAIISYLRTLPAVSNAVPAFEANMLGKVIKAFVLKPTGPTGEVFKTIAPSVSVEYGKYLANSVANCRGCHTNRDLQTGAFIGEDYAGGFHMEMVGKPGNFVVSRNLTPDAETGHIYNWSQEKFIERFRQGKLVPGSLMPWGPFLKFSDDDLRAIYMYLKTLKPVKNNPGPVLVSS